MLVAILVQALAAEAPALNLNLACEGQYQGTEVTRETVGAVTGAGYRTATGTSVTGVTRTGVGYATFTGSTGQITYPTAGGASSPTSWRTISRSPRATNARAC